jgi:hypothetical protein
LRSPLDRLLAGIGTRDVVLSDLETSWLIPSSRGRVIAAQHYEFFVPDQPRRIADLMAFFDEKTSAGCRLEILRRNRARWIVLNSSQITPRVFNDLMVPDAVVAHAGDLTLLDAECWARSMRKRPRDGCQGAGTRRAIPTDRLAEQRDGRAGSLGDSVLPAHRFLVHGVADLDVGARHARGGATHLSLDHFGVGRRLSTFAVFLAALNPVYLGQANTFMTDARVSRAPGDPAS